MSEKHDLLVTAMAVVPVLYLPVLFEYAKASDEDRRGRHRSPDASTDSDRPVVLLLFGIAFAWGELFAAYGVLQGDDPSAPVIGIVLLSIALGVLIGVAQFLQVQLRRIPLLAGDTP